MLETIECRILIQRAVIKKSYGHCGTAYYTHSQCHHLFYASNPSKRILFIVYHILLNCIVMNYVLCIF